MKKIWIYNEKAPPFPFIFNDIKLTLGHKISKKN